MPDLRSIALEGDMLDVAGVVRAVGPAVASIKTEIGGRAGGWLLPTTWSPSATPRGCAAGPTVTRDGEEREVRLTLARQPLQ